MKKHFLILKALLIVLVISGLTEIKSQVFLDLESGVVFSGYNDVRIPGDQGTLFSLSEELDASPKVFYRVRAGYTFGTRHNLSVLYAPFEVKSDGSLNRDLTFEGVIFPAGTPLEGTYKFNSYRLTYRYDIVERPKFEFGLGFTAKIRDAKVAILSAADESIKTNVGFVPIINFHAEWKAGEKLSFLVDGDALAAPQGRAEDVLVAMQYMVSEKVGIKAGYRILEGGADNDEVYNFSLFNYAAAGVVIRF
ncbi:MAG: hypothetical protein R6X09_04880 [Bacteroidales bacterium]